MSEEEFKKRDRSPNFPYLSLTQSLERAEALYGSAKGNSVRLSDAASDWGTSPTSSSTLRYASALIAFGLLADEGTGEARRIRLTDTALRILGDTRPGVRDELLQKAALNPALVREYYTKWGKNRPNDAHAVSTLIFDSSFTERAARTFLQVFDDAIAYVNDEASEGEDVQAKKVEENTKRAPSTEMAIGAEPLTHARDSSPDGVGPVSAALHESEWFKARVSKSVSVRILVDGEFDATMLGRLIRMLETQREMMEEDF